MKTLLSSSNDCEVSLGVNIQQERGEEKQWWMEGDDESGLYYPLVTTKSHGLTVLGGLSSLVGQPLPSCKSTLWKERFGEEVVGLSHIPKPACTQLYDTINSVCPLGSLLFLSHEMLSPRG